MSQIEEFAYGKDFPECPLTKDQVREIKASWIMFVQKKGSVEAAEKAVRKKLQESDSEFAQILYPDKARLRRDRGGAQADMNTGQMNDMKKQQRDLAAIFTATGGGGRAGGGSGGGCPFAGGAGGMNPFAAGGGGMSGAIAAMGGGDANAEADEWDREEIVAVLQKIREANKLGQAEDEQKKREAAEKQAAREAGRVDGDGAQKRATSRAKSRDRKANNGGDAQAREWQEKGPEKWPRVLSL